MIKFKFDIRVNGVKIEKIISANNAGEAKKLIQAEYGSNVQFIYYTAIH